MRVAFTGHRPDKLGGYDLNSPYNLKLKGRIKDLVKKVIGLSKHDSYEFYVGGALGVDTIAFDICRELKEELEEEVKIRAVLCIPFEGFEGFWRQESKDKLKECIDVADDFVIVNLLEDYYTSNIKYTYQKRNEFMVDHCDLLIAVYDGHSSGGTKNCVDYAKRIERRILTIGI